MIRICCPHHKFGSTFNILPDSSFSLLLKLGRMRAVSSFLWIFYTKLNKSPKSQDYALHEVVHLHTILVTTKFKNIVILCIQGKMNIILVMLMNGLPATVKSREKNIILCEPNPVVSHYYKTFSSVPPFLFSWKYYQLMGKNAFIIR